MPPQQRGLSSPCAPAPRWAAGRAGGGGAPGDTPAPRGRWGRRQGRGRPAGGCPKGFEFPFMLPLLSSSLWYFSSPLASLGLCLLGPVGLAASCGVGTSRLQRPSIRAGAHTPHPMLSTSLDES